MQNEHEILMQKKANFFFNKKKAVHIRHKDGHFSNGNILDVPAPDFIIIRELVDGEMPIFYQEIKDMVEFTTNAEKEKGVKT